MNDATESSEPQIARELRGFGPLGILAILVILFSSNITLGAIVLPAGAALVLVWARLSRTPWREIGYVRPKNWVGGVAVGIAFGCAFKLAMKAIVMPLLGADPINHAYHYLAGNTLVLAAAIPAMFAAGFGEETVYRGFLFERLGKLLGRTIAAQAAIVLLTTAWFALGHYAVQGLAGSEQAAITGLTFGTMYALTGRLWTVMWAHTAYDLAALALIYLNLESNVAHAVFR